MAKLELDFSGPPPEDYALIPKGWYVAEIVESDQVETNAGDPMLKLRWRINGPSHGGRVVFQNVMLGHRNPEVVRIGRQNLHRIAHSMGLARIVDTLDLHGRLIQVRITIQKGSGDHEDQNEVKGWRAAADGAARTTDGGGGGYQSPAPGTVGAGRGPSGFDDEDIGF